MNEPRYDIFTENIEAFDEDIDAFIFGEIDSEYSYHSEK